MSDGAPGWPGQSHGCWVAGEVQSAPPGSPSPLVGEGRGGGGAPRDGNHWRFPPNDGAWGQPPLTLPHKGGGNYRGLYLNSFSCPPKVGMGVSVPNASDSSSHQPKQPDSRGSSPAMTRRATLELAPIKAAPPSRIRVSGSASSGDKCDGPNNCSRRHARG